MPYFVLLRVRSASLVRLTAQGHTLLDQIEGAQAVALQKSIEKHISPRPGAFAALLIAERHSTAGQLDESAT